MKLKLDDSGSVVVSDGKPVYIFDNGKEVAFDAKSTTDKIQNLTREVDTLKTSNAELTASAEIFKDLDIGQVHKDREIVQNLSDKKLIDAGESERVKAQMAEVFNSEKGILKDAVTAKDAVINDLMIGSRFAESAFLRDNVILPSDMCRDSFGKNFKIENVSGKPAVVGYIGENKIYSQTNAGELAGFEESIQVIVGNYAMKDRILKSSDKGGSGAGAGGQNRKNNEDISKLSPTEKLHRARQHQKQT